jgi:hypothetical protein
MAKDGHEGVRWSCCYSGVYDLRFRILGTILLELGD